MFDYLADINWLAVLVAAAAYFILGWIWYSDVLFGKQYRAAIGHEGEASPAATALIINFVAWFVTAGTLAWLFAAIGVTTVGDGVLWALIVAVGLVAMERVVGVAYGGDNPKVMPINGPYHLVGFAVMGAVLVAMT